MIIAWLSHRPVSRLPLLALITQIFFFVPGIDKEQKLLSMSDTLSHGLEELLKLILKAHVIFDPCKWYCDERMH